MMGRYKTKIIIDPKESFTNQQIPIYSIISSKLEFKGKNSPRRKLPKERI